MKIHIVAPEPEGDGILTRLAWTLSNTTGWTLSNQPDKNADLNYSIIYIDWAQRFSDWKQTPWAAYFSHYERGTPYKEFWWNEADQGVRLQTVTARQYKKILSGRVIYTPPPIDPQYEIRDRKPNTIKRIGFAGFADKSGRKGQNLAALLASRFDGKVEMTATGVGWPVHCKTRKWEELPGWYNSLDLFICTSNIEGIPMPPLEALACGVPVVLPKGVGMLDDLKAIPGIYHYEAGNIDQLEKMVDIALSQEYSRDQLREAVSGYNAHAYAEAHRKGFEKVLKTSDKPQVIFESDAHGKRGVYYVAYGSPARKCAEGAVASFKQHFPDIPVALVSDKPLGIGDHFIEQEDTDIGGRLAKVRINELAPKEWQYIVYLDADTEIVKRETFLWDILSDGWDMVICKNPGRFAMAGNMRRSDNEDECQATFEKIGMEELIQLNGGVFGFQRNERTEAFFAAWVEEWKRWGKRDQAALLRALWRCPIRLYVLGNEWNTITRYDPPSSAAWLLHYPMTARRWRGMVHYRLDDPQAWEAVRQFEAKKQ